MKSVTAYKTIVQVIAVELKDHPGQREREGMRERIVVDSTAYLMLATVLHGNC